MVTDWIATLTEDGIELGSGDRLDADLIVTATGLNLHPLGGMTLAVDGEDVALPERMAYKGMMLGGVPNFAMASATRTPRGRLGATSRASTSAGSSTTWTSAATASACR